jgi:hypothetical protein
MRSLSSVVTQIGIVLTSTLVLACTSSSGNGSSGNDGGTPDGGTISFRNDLLKPPSPAIGFEFSCGLSSSCHRDPVHNPKTDRVFLGCNQMNATCTATGDIAETVYKGLVGDPEAGTMVPSQELPTMPYVKPGDPDNSWLVRKLEGTLSNLTCAAMDPIVLSATSEPVTPTPDCGTQMPLTANPDPTFNAKVRTWVKQGAPDN